MTTANAGPAYEAERLTPEEIEDLRRDMRETIAYAHEAFKHLPKIRPTVMLTPTEVANLQRAANEGSESSRKAFAHLPKIEPSPKSEQPTNSNAKPNR